MAQSDVMCSFPRPKDTSQGEAVITHAVRITFRTSGTHRSKNEKRGDPATENRKISLKVNY